MRERLVDGRVMTVMTSLISGMGVECCEKGVCCAMKMECDMLLKGHVIGGSGGERVGGCYTWTIV